MKIDLGLGEDELCENFQYWKAQVNTGNGFSTLTDESRGLATLPTTHTFGWRSGSSVELHRKILLENRALKSALSRKSEGVGAEPSFVADAATAAGLNGFVFTYLGIHEPYYSQTHFPAWGIFVSPKLETFPHCNATRRDLASPEVDRSLPIRLQFVLPTDARHLAILQVLHDERHGGKLKHFWGDPDLWDAPLKQTQPVFWEGTYGDRHWTWVPEFHFCDSVPLTEFSAVLWPVETVVNPYTFGRFPAPPTKDLDEFRTKNPDCAVVEYRSSFTKPGTALLRASAAAVEHFLANGSFPVVV